MKKILAILLFLILITGTSANVYAEDDLYPPIPGEADRSCVYTAQGVDYSYVVPSFPPGVMPNDEEALKIVHIYVYKWKGWYWGTDSYYKTGSRKNENGVWTFYCEKKYDDSAIKDGSNYHYYDNVLGISRLMADDAVVDTTDYLNSLSDEERIAYTNHILANTLAKENYNTTNPGTPVVGYVTVTIEGDPTHDTSARGFYSDKVNAQWDIVMRNMGPWQGHIDYVAPTTSPSTTTPTTTTTTTTTATSSNTQVRAFVDRMYTKVLGRNPDDGGAQNWTNQLVNHQIDGAGIAKGFVFSKEFLDKNLSNEDFVEVLYNTFLNRGSDAGGKTSWVSQLNAGASRTQVLAGFVNSSEFTGICENYGIARGTMDADGSVVYNEGTRNFVCRCYEKALGREGETAGIEDWCHRINTGSGTPQARALDVATNGFFHSQEFLNKNTSNQEFVAILYRTFLGREYDQAGFNDWVSQLNRGVSRDQVMRGFAYSPEFTEIMRGYGLN